MLFCFVDHPHVTQYIVLVLYQFLICNIIVINKCIVTCKASVKIGSQSIFLDFEYIENNYIVSCGSFI